MRRTLLGLAGLSVPGALFSTGVLLWFGYASQLVDTIGDTRQLGPLFLGVVAGSIIFSLIGYFVRASTTPVAVGTVAALLVLAISYVVMADESFVLDGALTFAVSFAMTSPLAPIGMALRLFREEYSRAVRVLMGATQALLTILLVFVYAFYYETNGQLDFYQGPLVMLALSIAAFLVLSRSE